MLLLATYNNVILQGINIGIVAITLPDMEIRTNSNTAEMSLLFMWIGAATIAGMLVIGPLYKTVSNMLLLSVCLLLSGVFTALGQIWPSLTTFQALVVLAVLFGSGAITGKLFNKCEKNLTSHHTTKTAKIKRCYYFCSTSP